MISKIFTICALLAISEAVKIKVDVSIHPLDGEELKQFKQP